MDCWERQRVSVPPIVEPGPTDVEHQADLGDRHQGFSFGLFVLEPLFHINLAIEKNPFHFLQWKSALKDVAKG